MAASISGTPNAAAPATSVAIPTHAVGDEIVIFAYNNASTTVPTKPAAAGTVPAWADIDAPPGANTNSSRTAHFKATATNHTSGTWTGATGMTATVVSGATGGIGGHAEAGGASANAAQAPAVTLTKTDGTSVLLEHYGHRTVTAWSAAPAGYTRQTSVATSVCLNSKNSTTTDGAVNQSNTATNSGYRGATVELYANSAMSTLADTFDAGIGANWNTTGSGNGSEVTAYSSAVKIAHTAAAEYNYLNSAVKYDLTGSAAYVQVADYGNQALVSHDVYLNLVLDVDGTNSMRIIAEGGSLICQKFVATVKTNLVVLTLDQVAHRWLRIRESGGTTYFDTSADGLAWSNQASTTNPFAVTALTASLVCGCYQTEASGSYAVFDNFNTPPAIGRLVTRQQAVNRAGSY